LGKCETLAVVNGDVNRNVLMPMRMEGRVEVDAAGRR
jgi:hypothetical protein